MAKTIGRYEIRAELGRGGMAAVYLAIDPKLDREVALKLMDQQLSTDPTFVARFEREAKTVASLEHGAIVSLYDYGEADGWLYLVMRYMKGGSLKELIARGALEGRQAYGVVRRIGAALDKAHSMGIVHRDLKPANILLDAEQESYLSDFGIVKVAKGDKEYLTETGQTLGTFAYMSPEQVMGQDLDGRSDIYALGLILYEMMTGKHPYGETATSSGAMAVAHTAQPVPDINEANPAAPAALNEVIQKAMAKKQDDRYASGREMTLAMYEAMVRKPAATTTATVAAAAAGTAAVQEKPPELSPAPPAGQPAATPAPVSEQPSPPAPAPQQVVVPPASQPASQPPASQPPAPQQQAPTPASRQSAPVPVSQPAAQPATKKRSKMPTWIFAIAGVAAVAVIGILVVVIGLGGGGDPIENESNENDSDSGGQGPGSNENTSNENDSGNRGTNGDAEALFLAAEEALYGEDDPQTAIEQINEAIALDPNAAQFYVLRAEAKTREPADYPGAIADADMAIELEPSNSGYYALRGNLHRDQGDFDLAEADYMVAIDLAPDDAWLYIGLGNIYGQMGDSERAMSSFADALNVDSQNADIYTAIAGSLHFGGLGTTDEAIEVLSECVNQVQDRTYWCNWERAWIFDSQGATEEAAADLQTFLANVPAGECSTCETDAQNYLANSTSAGACPASNDGRLVLWADGVRAPSVRDLGGEFESVCGVELVVEETELFDIGNELVAAVEAGEGPDIYLSAHDSLGMWLNNGLAAPIDLGAKGDDFTIAGLDAFTTGGDLYGLPISLDSLVLFRNTDLVPNAPESWDEILEIGFALRETGAASEGLVIPDGAYFTYPIATLFGGYIFGRDADGTWNVDDLGIDGDGMMTAASWLAETVAAGYVGWYDYSSAQSLFMNGEAPFLLNGPWALDEIRNSGVPYAISRFPLDSRPLNGAIGFIINANSPDTALAQYFLTEFVATESVMSEMAASVDRPSAYIPVIQATNDPDRTAMAEAVINGWPIPAIFGINEVWGPWGEALSLTISGELTADEALSNAAEQIRATIGN